VRSPDVAVTGRHLLAIFTGTKFATRGGALLRSAASFRDQYQKVHGRIWCRRAKLAQTQVGISGTRRRFAVTTRFGEVAYITGVLTG
jgi:hypothetical protein